MDSISKVLWQSASYPKLLGQIPDHPKELFVRGNLELLQNEATLAIVGTRKASSYGLNLAEKFAAEAASAGLVIISGLARGIDAAAHKGCLKAGGRTIAVLGLGVEDEAIYPSEHKNLAHEIIKAGGTLLSEHSGKTGLPYQFATRDRIIAGLSQATLVIEAPIKSGSLITATCALDYNREVLAIPGNIGSPNAEGTNKLIKQGAKVVTEIADILDVFNLLPLAAQPRSEIKFTPEQVKIIACLENGPATLSDVVVNTGLDINTVTSALTLLELSDKISSHIDGTFALK